MANSRLSGYDLRGRRTSSSVRIDLDELTRLVTTQLEASGFPPERATLVADSLTDAEARGIASHGVTRVRIYSERARRGMTDPAAELSVSGSGSLYQVDAHNAPGQVGVELATNVAIDVAAQTRVGLVCVSNSNHCGALGYFLRRIAVAGYVGLAITNGPPVMAYFGGRTRAVGTNPLGYSVPRRQGEPIVLDMATSNAARGKIIGMARADEGVVPEGWALDEAGRPTTDPVAALAGAVLPFAGPKGSGLAMGIDLLCGALLTGVSGSKVGDMYEDWSRPQQVGHVIGAVRVGDGGQDPFDSVEEFVDEVHGLPTAPGYDQVLLPGEIEDRQIAQAARDGVELPPSVAGDLVSLCEELQVPVPDSLNDGVA